MKTSAAVLAACLCGANVCGAAAPGSIRAAAAAATARAAAPDYGLQPLEVAPGVYVFAGRMENFSRDNGGNIVNTGFIVGTDGCIVIDSGPSRLYGEQQRAAIARISPLPVLRVFVTHAHPDHFLGDQAYPPGTVAALPATAAAIRSNGDGLSGNLYRLVGGWMTGTDVVAPAVEVVAGEVTVAGRALRLIGAAGHTDADLMVYDEKTRVLFSGDLVFFQRAATTPNADLDVWLASLDAIDRLDFATLVPGHGPVVHDHAAIAQTRDYLRWLRATLREAADRGLDMPEVMRLPLPERFKTLAVVEGEYARSVSHLYPRIELDSLPPLKASPPSAR